MPHHQLVILSGGQDSTTVLWMAGHSNAITKVSAITVDYGQRHLAELDAARNVWAEFTERFPTKADQHEVISVPSVLAGSSPLVSPNDLKEYEDRASMEAEVGDRIEQAFVPGRNLLFLVLAANRASAWNCDSIALGICEQDATNFPDCRDVFLDAAEDVIAEALERHIPLIAPLIKTDKCDAIRQCLPLPGWYHVMRLTRTSYAGEFPPVTRDHASILRADSFARAGVADPMMVDAALQGLCPMPPGLGDVTTFAEAERRAGAAA